jgi:hypothetical protein
MGRSIEQENSFLQVLVKLIPSEVIAVFVFIQGVMPRQFWPHLVVALLLVAITPLYLWRVSGVRERAQLLVSTLSMVVWIYALGAGPLRFVKPPFYEPWHGGVALAVWTLVPPMFISRGAGEPAAGRARGRADARAGKTAPAPVARGNRGRPSRPAARRSS